MSWHGQTRMPRSKPWILLLLLAMLTATTVGAAACGGDDDATDQAAAENGELEQVGLLLSYQRSIAFIGEIMAQENGYFADEGLEVEPQATEGGGFVVQQVSAGNASLALAGTQNIDVAVSQGHDLRAIWRNDEDIILVGAPAEGEVQTFEDLEGKALGITGPGSGEQALVRAALDRYGMLDSVETPAVGDGGPAVIRALETGRIAAYAGYTNDLAGVQAGGMEFIDILPEEFQGMPNNSLFLSEDAYNDQAQVEAAVKIARAWTRGTIDALNDPEAALEIACGEYVPEECEDRAVAAAFMNVTLEGAVPPEGSNVFGEFNYDALERQAATLREADLGPNPINFEEVFTNDYVAEINDFDQPQYEPGSFEPLDVGDFIN